MRQQKASEAIGNAGRLLGRFGLVVIVVFVLASFSSNDSPPRTETQSSGNIQIAENLKNYQKRDYNEVARNKDGMAGKLIDVEGKVIQSTSSWGNVVLRVASSNDYDEVYYVKIPEDSLDFNILEDDYVSVQGTLAGLKSYKSVLGAQVTIPAIDADKIELQ